MEVEDNKDSNDYEIICRICCRQIKSSIAISIFDDFDENIKYSRIIMMCFPVSISEEDNLPNFMCDMCRLRINDAYSLRLLCIDSDKQLRELSNDDKVPLFVEVKTELNVIDEEDEIEEQVDEIIESDQNYDILEDIKSEVSDDDSDDSDSDYVAESSKSTTRIRHRTKSKPYECDLCNERYGTQRGLDHHKLKHSDLVLEHTTIIEIPQLDEYKCCYCTMTFKDLLAMYSHRKKTHVEDQKDENFKCDYCLKKIKTLKFLRFHIRKHTNNKIRRCNICMKAQEVDKRLLEHINRHRGIKQFPCETCKKAFKTTAGLREHTKIHVGNYSFLCPECGRAFKNSSNLRSHMMHHTGQKPHCCKLCPSRFKFKCEFSLFLCLDKLVTTHVFFLGPRCMLIIVSTQNHTKVIGPKNTVLIASSVDIYVCLSLRKIIQLIMYFILKL